MCICSPQNSLRFHQLSKFFSGLLLSIPWTNVCLQQVLNTCKFWKCIKIAIRFDRYHSSLFFHQASQVSPAWRSLQKFASLCASSHVFVWLVSQATDIRQQCRRREFEEQEEIPIVMMPSGHDCIKSVSSHMILDAVYPSNRVQPPDVINTAFLTWREGATASDDSQ